MRSKEMHFEQDNFTDWPESHLKQCPMCGDATATPIATATPAPAPTLPATPTQTPLRVGARVFTINEDMF